jgi:large subunit ribosomal protein L4
LLKTPIRRDLLWRAVVYDADNKRVGSSNPNGRSEMGYSRKKLLPQKGTGKARSGDRSSPIRHDGAVAHARSAPNDFTSELPKKIYSKAIHVALSEKYRQGELFVIEDDLEIPHKKGNASLIELFLIKNNLKGLKLLFITNEHAPNLVFSTQKFEDKIDIVQKEGLEVKDLLHPHKIFIDLKSLEWLYKTYQI